VSHRRNLQELLALLNHVTPWPEASAQIRQWRGAVAQRALTRQGVQLRAFPLHSTQRQRLRTRVAAMFAACDRLPTRRRRRGPDFHSVSAEYLFRLTETPHLGSLRCCPTCARFFVLEHKSRWYCSARCRESARPRRTRARAAYMRTYRQALPVKRRVTPRKTRRFPE